MRACVIAASLLVASAAPVAAAGALAPPSKVQEMLGDVGVMANKGDDRCTVALFEDKVEQGYKLTFFEDSGKCAAAFPVMAKVVAWRVYTDGRMTFVDVTGNDVIIFKKGKGFKRYAANKVDGIAYLHSAQEVAE
ncbi:MAG: AprI/Inh family metalloprotease inhibitor [Hyphomicrobiaceae bacterium]|nr:AprI/Inh family metalloprotease inhibitor [Hyphomicrobiaceae bacterium]